VVSYSVLVGGVMIAFAVGLVLGRRNARPGGIWASPGGAATSVKGIEVPPRAGPAAAPASRTLSVAAENELRRHLERGHMIEAIKRYRELTGVGLREAKEGVEAMRRQQGPPAP
jgi:hypothetical protein